jgi:large subunit ribosomal protein L10
MFTNWSEADTDMRAEKQLIVEELARQLSASPFVLLTDYAGMTVAQFSELRKRLRKVNAECHVVKNSMLRLAMKAAGRPSPDGGLSGMTAIVLGSQRCDLSAAARVIKQFKGEFDRPRFKLAVLGEKLLAAEEVAAVADLPPLEALRAQLVGLLRSPATRIAVALAAPAAQLARVLKARAETQTA